MNQEIWALMAKCAFDEASEEEILLLHSYLNQNPQLQQQYDWFLLLVSKEENIQNTSSETASRAINKILNKAAILEERQHKRKKKQVLRILSYAASILLVLGLGYLLFLKGNHSFLSKVPKPIVAKSELIPKPVVLPDGSKVWLNAGSTLDFETDFKGKTREVRLIGEAYFDVVKNKEKPFIVHVGEININVLGTAFNVKGYKEDNTIQTTLYRGLVKVTKSKDKHFQPIMLYPNQTIKIPKSVIASETKISEEKNAIEISAIDSTEKDVARTETAWMFGRIDFKGETLEEVTNKMAYRYHIKFVFEDEASKKLNYTGSFVKESLDQALKALKTANPFNYKIENNEVIISAIK